MSGGGFINGDFNPGDVAVLSIPAARVRMRFHHDAIEKVLTAYELLHLPVQRYLLATLYNREAAEDVVQEVFLRLLRHVTEGNAVPNVRLWLFQVAHNLAIDLKREKRFVATFEPPEWDLLISNRRDETPNPEQAAIQRERYESMKHAMELLTENERQVLNMRIEGLRYREIGEVLALSTSTVADILHRCMQKLKAELDA